MGRLRIRTETKTLKVDCPMSTPSEGLNPVRIERDTPRDLDVKDKLNQDMKPSKASPSLKSEVRGFELQYFDLLCSPTKGHDRIALVLPSKKFQTKVTRR